jgi:hypothetical protein
LPAAGDRYHEAPRQRPAARRVQQTSPLLLILAIVGGVIFVSGIAGTVCLVWYLNSGSGGGGPLGGGNAQSAPVTINDLDKVEIFMTKDQVETAIGPGQKANLQDIHPNWIETGRQVQVSDWYEWQGGKDRLYVGFGKGSSGTYRAVVAFYVQDNSKGNVFAQNTKIGFINIDLFRNDLDLQAADRQKERDLLKAPRWEKGPAIRKSLVGFWVADLIGAQKFNADGTYEESMPGSKFTGTYRFLNDDTVEISKSGVPDFPGQGVKTSKHTCRVLVDATELILVDNDFPNASPIAYQRR